MFAHILKFSFSSFFKTLNLSGIFPTLSTCKAEIEIDPMYDASQILAPDIKDNDDPTSKQSPAPITEVGLEFNAGILSLKYLVLFVLLLE